MIRYLKNQFIDRQKYDRCIGLDARGNIYGHSWYLDLTASNWDALVMDDYQAVWPLPWRKKYGFKYFYRPVGIQQLGIFSLKALDSDQLLAFYKAMTRQASFSEVWLNAGDQPLEIPGIKLEFKPNINLKLPLAKDYRQVFESFNKNRQRIIKKLSRGNELSLFEHDDPQVLIQLFRQNQGQKYKLPDDFYQTMKKLMYRALHRNCARLLTVYGPPNQIVAGAFFLENQGRQVFLFSAIDKLGREYNAMDYLLNEFLIYHSDRSRELDFEGSNLEGLQHYYRSFGAREETYYQLRYNGLPSFLKWLKK